MQSTKSFHEKCVTPKVFELTSSKKQSFLIHSSFIPVADGEPIRISEVTELEKTPTGNFVLRVITKAVQIQPPLEPQGKRKTYILTLESL